MISKEYVKETSISLKRGKVQTYLVMTINKTDKKKVKVIYIYKKIKNM